MGFRTRDLHIDQPQSVSAIEPADAPTTGNLRRGLHNQQRSPHPAATSRYSSAVDATADSIFEQELLSSLRRWALTTPGSCLAAILTFALVDALATGIVMAAVMLFSGSMHSLAVWTSWFLRSKWFGPGYVAMAVATGAIPLIALPASQDGQTLLLLSGGVIILTVASGLSARRSLAFWLVSILGSGSVVAWGLSDTHFDSALPEVALAVITVIALATLDESSARHRRLVEQSMASLRTSELDSLTGLYRRSAFLGLVDRATIEGGPGTLFFVDLDRFKLINDTLGHKAGDELLVATAGRIDGLLRGHDFAGRIGGDEFALFVPGMRRNSARDMGNRLAGLFENDFRLLGHSVPITASIGVATAADQTTSAADLMHYADVAMYSAKRDDRAVRYFGETMRTRLLQLEETELALRAALRQNDIVAHLQAIVRSTDNRIVGFEALARWHRDGAIVGAGDFIESAERGKLLPAVTRAVAHDVLGFVNSRKQDNPPVVGVNVEAGDLAAFLRWTEEVEMDPNQWTIEITESQVLKNETKAVRDLRRAADMGFGIFLDDFGTGYSSLARILKLPIDGIKIDGSFVGEIEQSRTARAIVSAVTHLAGDCDLSVIAEGVETVRQVDVLRELGVSLMQGYYFQKPASIDDILDLRSFDAAIARPAIARPA